MCMKASEQYFLVVLFILVYKMVLTVESVDVTIQMKATEKYLLVALVTRCAVKVILAFKY